MLTRRLARGDAHAVRALLLAALGVLLVTSEPATTPTGRTLAAAVLLALALRSALAWEAAGEQP